jgi:hypothetical protein
MRLVTQHTDDKETVILKLTTFRGLEIGYPFLFKGIS